MAIVWSTDGSESSKGCGAFSPKWASPWIVSSLKVSMPVSNKSPVVSETFAAPSLASPSIFSLATIVSSFKVTSEAGPFDLLFLPVNAALSRHFVTFGCVVRRKPPVESPPVALLALGTFLCLLAAISVAAYSSSRLGVDVVARGGDGEQDGAKKSASAAGTRSARGGGVICTKERLRKDRARFSLDVAAAFSSLLPRRIKSTSPSKSFTST
mmetsp:Transcript_1831/g.5342  ORF Transcript_1831/g.5342 Transcript_1831/m.5342 type:complete len:212 (+) Transcript_1831:434-1069(+)